MYNFSSRKKTSPLVLQFANKEKIQNSEAWKPSEICDHQTDIIPIHNYISKTLRKKTDLDKLKERRKQIIDKRESSTKLRSPIEIRKEKDELSLVDDKIRSIEEEETYLQYMEEIDPILQEWKESGGHSYVVDLRTIDIIDTGKVVIIKKFISIARQYLPDYRLQFKDNRKENSCPYCYSENLKEEVGFYVCSGCGINIRKFSNDIIFDDLNRISSISNNYHNKSIFSIIITCYQGEQEPKWTPELNPNWNINNMIEEVIEHFRILGQPIVSVTPQDILRAFNTLSGGEYGKERKPYNKHYNDFILFTHILNDWELPKIKEHIEDLENDYDEFYQGYEIIKKETNRDSALNCWVLFYKLILRRGIPHRRENFKLLTTDEVFLDVEDLIEKTFHLLETRRISEGQTHVPCWKFINSM